MNGLHDEIFLKYKEANRLHGVIFEITHSCPCNCGHCLLVKTLKDELCLEEIADLLRQLRVEGTFNLGITGGEPFLREDLEQILKLARKDRFFISILTTGILIGRPEVNLLHRLGIGNLEISLLGAGPYTHDSIMQFPGAFNRMVQAVKRLREAGISVVLKSTIMKQNWKELAAMAKIARDLETQFSTSISVSPRVDGDFSPQRWALTEEEVVQINPALINSGLIPGEENSTGALLTCNAGRTIAGISPQGDIFPCIIFRHKVGNIPESTLQDIWHANPDPLLNELRQLKPEEVSECFTCELKSLCQRCPGVAYLESRRLLLPSRSACVNALGLSRASRSHDALISSK